MTKQQMFNEAHKAAVADVAWTKANFAEALQPYAHYFRLARLNLQAEAYTARTGMVTVANCIVSAKDAGHGIWGRA